MSSNHKAPLAAFVVVAIACVVVLATNSMRSYARGAWHTFAAPVVGGLTLVHVHHAAPQQATPAVEAVGAQAGASAARAASRGASPATAPSPQRHHGPRGVQPSAADAAETVTSGSSAPETAPTASATAPLPDQASTVAGSWWSNDDWHAGRGWHHGRADDAGASAGVTASAGPHGSAGSVHASASSPWVQLALTATGHHDVSALAREDAGKHRGPKCAAHDKGAQDKSAHDKGAHDKGAHDKAAQGKGSPVTCSPAAGPGANAADTDAASTDAVRGGASSATRSHESHGHGR